MEKDKMKKCECCAELFDINTEPPEVKEGGVYMCPDCWNEPEHFNS